MVMEGRSLMEVRDILGYSTVKMTERYAHLAPENLVDAVSSIEDRLHP
jgi:site-specific recombinase XerD